MSHEQNTVDPYELVLTDLYAKQAQIVAAIAAIEGLRGHSTHPMQGQSGPPLGEQGNEIRSGMFVGMTIAAAAKQALAMRKQPMTTPEILSALLAGGVVFSTATPGNTVGSVLHRESRSGDDVVSVGRGKWALSVWLKNPGRFQKKASPEAKGESAEVMNSDEAAAAANEAAASSASPPPSGPYPRAVGE